MPVFDDLQRASFDGLEFPIKSVSVRGSYRKHSHEYLRVPGAITEKLERGLYVVEMEALFHATIRGYGQLWPNTLAAMRNKYEQGITSELVIPTIGTIPAFQDEWMQQAAIGTVRSGETITLHFLEDQTETFLTLALAKVDTTSLSSSTSKLAAIREELSLTESDRSIFDGIQDAANSLFAIKDQADLFGGLVAAKVLQLEGIIRQADEQLESTQNPENWLLVDALHELWDSVVTLGRNLAESPRGPRLYIVPRIMTVSDIATALYGDTERASEILLNNSLPDPFAVTAGTKIIWFEG